MAELSALNVSSQQSEKFDYITIITFYKYIHVVLMPVLRLTDKYFDLLIRRFSWLCNFM